MWNPLLYTGANVLAAISIIYTRISGFRSNDSNTRVVTFVIILSVGSGASFQ